MEPEVIAAIIGGASLILNTVIEIVLNRNNGETARKKVTKKILRIGTFISLVIIVISIIIYLSNRNTNNDDININSENRNCNFEYILDETYEQNRNINTLFETENLSTIDSIKLEGEIEKHTNIRVLIENEIKRYKNKVIDCENLKINIENYFNQAIKISENAKKEYSK